MKINKNHLFCSALFSFLISFSSLAKPVVVFVPGAGSTEGGMSNPLARLVGLNEIFKKFQMGLEEKGIESFICPKSHDSDMRTIEERQKECVRMISEHNSCANDGQRNVILFGHSMGGLISRLVAKDPKVSTCIRSVTTLSTPHKGTVLADYAAERLLSEELLSIHRWIVLALGYYPEKKAYFFQLKSDRTDFPEDLFIAQDVEDNPEVKYFSFSTSFNFSPILPLYLTKNIINEELIKRGWDKTEWGTQNDGLVPVYSQIYGEHVAHIDASHFEAVCADLTLISPGCSRAYPLIIDHLIGQSE